jgi:hypothetical protein
MHDTAFVINIFSLPLDINFLSIHSLKPSLSHRIEFLSLADTGLCHHWHYPLISWHLRGKSLAMQVPFKCDPSFVIPQPGQRSADIS